MADGDSKAGPIVVGVDGSEASVDALRWAVAQARRTGAALHAVTAWAFPEHRTPFGIVPEIPVPPDELTEVGEHLDAAVAAALDGGDDLEVDTSVVDGEIGPVLVQAAHGASLLVVGSRGRNPVADLLLGSVSDYCVRHAPCPVVVVRHHAT